MFVTECSGEKKTLHVITYQKSFYEVLYKAFDIGETCLIAC